MINLIYKNTGEHIARIEGDWLVHRDGRPIGYIEDNKVYSIEEGEYIGEITDDGRVLKEIGENFSIKILKGNPGDFGDMGYAGNRGHYGSLPAGVEDAMKDF